MAAIFADSPEGIIRTSGLRTSTQAYTACWYIEFDDFPSGLYTTWLYQGDDPAVYSAYIWIGQFPGGGVVVDINGSTESSSLAAGRHHLAYVRASATDHKLYINGILAIASTDDSTAVTVTDQLIGTDQNAAGWYPSEVAYVREWTVALTQAEINAERLSATVVKTANLLANAPLSADLNDISGNANHWSASGGTITYGAQPGIPAPPPFLVQQAITVAMTTDPDTATYPADVAAGSGLAILLELDDPAVSVVGVTDGTGNTWQLGVAAVVNARAFESWFVPSAVGGATTVTFDLTAASVARVWMIEITNILDMTFGISNTLDQTVSIDPVPLATLSPTESGVAMTAIRYAATETFANWMELNSFMVDAGGGSSSRGGFRSVPGAVALTPEINNSTAATGESMTVVYYGTPLISLDGTRLYPSTRPCNTVMEGPPGGEWGISTGIVSGLTVQGGSFQMDLQKGLGGSVSQTLLDETCNQQGDFDFLSSGVRFLTPPLLAQTIAGTFNYCQRVRARWLSSSGYTNDTTISLKSHVYISVGRTLAVRHTLLDNHVDSAQFTGTSGLHWRELGAAQALAPGDCLDGDSIVIEVAFRIVSSPTPTVTYPPSEWSHIEWTGKETVGEFPDAVSGETTADLAPWFQFSQSLFFQPSTVVPPDNDACSDAIVVASFPYASDFIDTTESQDEHRGAWWTFTAPTTGEIIITGYGSNYALALTVYTGGCGALAVADFGGINNFLGGRDVSVAMLNATMGTQYWVTAEADSDPYSMRDAGGALRITMGYRQEPQADDIYMPSYNMHVFREGTLVNVNPTVAIYTPLGVAIDYTERPMVNAGGSPGGDPHEGERVLLSLFHTDPSIVEIFDLPTLSFTSASGSDIDIINDPWSPTTPQPSDIGIGGAFLHVTSAGLLVSQWQGNGFHFVSGSGTNRPAFLNTIPSDTSFSAVRTIDSTYGDSQAAAPYSDQEDVVSVEVNCPWGGWFDESSGILYYVSGNTLFPTNPVDGNEIRRFNVYTRTQLATFATLSLVGTGSPGLRGCCGIVGSSGALTGMLVCNGSVIQRLDTAGAVVGTFTPSVVGILTDPTLRDVKILSDGLHAYVIDGIYRQIWKFNIDTMTEIDTWPTYATGSFYQMALYQPSGVTPEPEAEGAAMPCIHGSYAPQIALTGSYRTEQARGSYTPTTE